jgi:hypothetical protein
MRSSTSGFRKPLPKDGWRIVPDISAHVIFSTTHGPGGLVAECRIVGARTTFFDLHAAGRTLTIGARLRPGVLHQLVRDSAAAIHGSERAAGRYCGTLRGTVSGANGRGAGLARRSNALHNSFPCDLLHESALPGGSAGRGGVCLRACAGSCTEVVEPRTTGCQRQLGWHPSWHCASIGSIGRCSS